MPTYRNDATSSFLVEGTSGLLEKVDPGGSIQTFKILSADLGFTKIDDDPAGNLINAIHELKFFSSQEVKTLGFSSLDDRMIEINNLSEKLVVSVYAAPRSAEDSPLLVVGPDSGTTGVSIGPEVTGVVLTVNRAGTCQVVEIYGETISESA